MTGKRHFTSQLLKDGKNKKVTHRNSKNNPINLNHHSKMKLNKKRYSI